MIRRNKFFHFKKVVMSSESIPVGLQTLLAKHYFLAQITRGYKPCMTNMTLIDASSWWGSFCRTWYGESRKTVISDIEKIVSETIDSISTHKHREEFLRLIINALARTRVGLESMTTTYRSDPDMIGRLRVQLTNIDLQLDKYRGLIKGYSETGPEVDAREERIIDKVVESADVSDKEGLRKFLMGKAPPIPPTIQDEKPRSDRSRSDNSRGERSVDKRRRRNRQSSDVSEDN